MALIRRQIAVIGLGRFGLTLASELANRGHEVLGIDLSEDVVEQAASILTHAVVADASDEVVLDRLGIRGFDLAIVALGTEELASILSAMALKRLEVPRVIARARSDLHGEVLRRVGVEKVIYPERDMGFQLAHAFFSAFMEDYIDLGPEYGVSKLAVPPALVGRSAEELGLERAYGLTLLAIQRGQEVDCKPSTVERLRAGDAIVVLGRDDDLDRLLNRRR